MAEVGIDVGLSETAPAIYGKRKREKLKKAIGAIAFKRWRGTYV